MACTGRPPATQNPTDRCQRCQGREALLSVTVFSCRPHRPSLSTMSPNRKLRATHTVCWSVEGASRVPTVARWKGRCTAAGGRCQCWLLPLRPHGLARPGGQRAPDLKSVRRQRPLSCPLDVSSVHRPRSGRRLHISSYLRWNCW